MSESSEAPAVDDAEGTIFYLGYGPIVNKVVRKRRGLKTSNEQPALLPEHRLTFAFGGAANIVPQRGFEVYGVLMTFHSKEDWQDFQKFDAGYNLDRVKVYPCQTPDKEVMAYTFVMKDFDEEKLEGCEKLPQERYLKLIASGLRSHNVDHDYIEDHIMSVPYVPKAKPDDFKRFPLSRQPLPRISFADYEERLCRNAAPGDTFFILNNRVIQIDPHDPENPCAVWFRQRAHGEPDLTLKVHTEIVDPDIPAADTEQELTDLHYRWCENHCIEYLTQGGLSATAIFELGEPGESITVRTSELESAGMTRFCSTCCCWSSSSRDNSGETTTSANNNLRLSTAPGAISSELMNRDWPRGNDVDTDEDSTG